MILQWVRMTGIHLTLHLNPLIFCCPKLNDLEDPQTVFKTINGRLSMCLSKQFSFFA
jgi:hypothetical protein